MNLEEARKIVAEQDATDPARTIEAVATLARFDGIANKRMLPIAERLEAIALKLKQKSAPSQ